MSEDGRVQRLQRPDGNTVAYARTAGRTPTVVFLGGFRSDMTGTKAVALEAWAQRTGQAYLRFDYLGHGQSSGLGPGRLHTGRASGGRADRRP